MPRRDEPDPLAAAIGAKIRALREARGLKLERQEVLHDDVGLASTLLRETRTDALGGVACGVVLALGGGPRVQRFDLA